MAMVEVEPPKENIFGPKLAYVYPGQGSQFPGMGLELYNNSKAARDVFDKADEALGFPLSKLIFEGSGRELDKTVNSQPAIMAMSLACEGAWRERNPQDTMPTVVAGHSLGEYTALVVTGVLDLADGIRLVRERGRLMQEASKMSPGSMAAIIGLEEQIIEEICRETGAEIANINGGDQIVLSGNRLCVARAMDMATQRGAKKAIPLAVSGAFHSSLMAPARDGLVRAIDQIDFNDARIPIIGNTSSERLTTVQRVKEELSTQLTSCVRWKESVHRMIDQEVVSFIEFGPGKVLSGLIKRIGAAEEYKKRGISIGTSSIGDLSSIQNFKPLPAQKVA